MPVGMWTWVSARKHALDGDSHWCHLANTTESSMCGCEVALCQITLTTWLSAVATRGTGTHITEPSRQTGAGFVHTGHNSCPCDVRWTFEGHLFGWSAVRLRTIYDALYKSPHHHHHHHSTIQPFQWMQNTDAMQEKSHHTGSSYSNRLPRRGMLPAPDRSLQANNTRQTSI